MYLFVQLLKSSIDRINPNLIHGNTFEAAVIVSYSFGNRLIILPFSHKSFHKKQSVFINVPAIAYLQIICTYNIPLTFSV